MVRAHGVLPKKLIFVLKIIGHHFPGFLCFQVIQTSWKINKFIMPSFSTSNFEAIKSLLAAKLHISTPIASFTFFSIIAWQV